MLGHFRIYVNQDIALSSTADVLNKIQNIAVIKSQEHLLELEFNNGQSNQSRDFRPDLPLIFKW